MTADFPTQCAATFKRIGKLITQPAPMNPVPIVNSSQAVAHGARRQMFKTACDHRGADLGNVRVGPQQAYRDYFERPKLSPAEDERRYGNTFACRIS